MDLRAGDLCRRLSKLSGRNTNLRNLQLAGMLCVGVATASVGSLAQTATPQLYTLVAGSQLTDDCPICDRLPIVVPMTGTFGLRVVEQNPLFTRYEVLDIAFHAGTNSGPEYQVQGRGTYRTGGEVMVVQDMFLDLEIDNGGVLTKAASGNLDRVVGQPWPRLQINVDQTNGTPNQIYYLTLIAVPVPTIRLLIPAALAGDVRLDWDGNGGKFQLQRATDAAGNYQPLTPFATSSPFTDVAVFTNYPQAFYRLRQF